MSESDAPPDRLAALVDRAVELEVDRDPVWATRHGRHERDEQLPDESPEARGRHAEETRALLSELAALPDEGLDLEQRVDRDMLRNRLELALLVEEEVRPAARDPLRYQRRLGSGLHDLVARESRPLEHRVEAFRARLEAVPAYLEQAAANLEGCPRPHVEVALGQLHGLEVLTRSLESREDPGLDAAAERARAALGEWRRHLETALLPDADEHDWRLGADLYDRKLALELDVGLDREELHEAAFEEVCFAHRRMLDAARRLEGRTPPPFQSGTPLEPEEREEVAAALHRISEDRPARDGLVQECRDAVAEVRAFSDGRGLVGEYPEDELRVELWPEFGRGVAVACLDPPGAFEHAEVPSFFYISPVPEDWDDARAESFLREYNCHQLRSLAAHEAFPGHFVQIAVARRHPSPVRSAWASGTYVEGWAVYCETMVLDEGFRDHDPAFALAVWKMRLRTALNTLLDQFMQLGTRPPEACLRMLRNAGFQEEGEAVGKIQRARISSCQLATYFAGVTAFQRLRKVAEAVDGADFSLARYHQRLLATGVVSPRHLPRLLGIDP